MTDDTPSGELLKVRGDSQTVCDEPAAKGKPCHGHLKRHSYAPPELLAAVAPGNHLFRCQRCGRLYQGAPLRHLH